MQDKTIKKLRLELGLSQERFARLLGVALQTVRRWEAGISRPLPLISLKLEELQREARKVSRPPGGIPMTEEARKPREGIEIGFGGLFKGIGNLLDLVSQMVEEGKEEHIQSGEAETLGGKVKGVYGISVRLGLGGKPIIEPFGNIRATEAGAAVTEAREPLVDVFDEGELMVVIAELPGVEDTDIHLELKDDILDLRAEGRDRKYATEVLLPAPAEAATMQRSYHNGILKVEMKKRPGQA